MCDDTILKIVYSVWYKPFVNMTYDVTARKFNANALKFSCFKVISKEQTLIDIKEIYL